MKCQLESTRERGIEVVAPITENPAVEIFGRPKSNLEVTSVSRPMDEGSRMWCSGTNASTKRFHPKRISFTWLAFTTFTYERDISCTRVGVTVLNPGNSPPASWAKGKL